MSGLLGNSSLDDEDSDEDKYVTNGVLGVEAPKKIFPKVLSEKEKRIWSAISWPTSLTDAFQKVVQMAKAKSLLTAQAFRATPSM